MAEMKTMELDLDEMEAVSGGWSWKSFGLGAEMGSFLGGIVAGTVAAGLVASGPAGWAVLGGAIAGGAALGTYAGVTEDGD